MVIAAQGGRPYRTSRVLRRRARQLGVKNRARILSPPLEGPHRLSHLQPALWGDASSRVSIVAMRSLRQRAQMPHRRRVLV